LVESLKIQPAYGDNMRLVGVDFRQQEILLLDGDYSNRIK
jgi:hypothetical protein